MKKTYSIIYKIILFNFIIVTDSYSQDFKKSVITDPSISRRCESLMEKRNKKIKHKQKISALLSRNLQVQKVVPPRKKTLRSKLQKNQGSLKRELHLTLSKITRLEENIVRRGCPGITL
jgi:hypothetical protein